MIKYKQILEKLRDEQKIEFLEKIIQNSEQLQSQLVAYFTNDISDTESTPLKFDEHIKNSTKEYLEVLEEIDLEEFDYDRRSYHDRYYDQWEIEQEEAEEEFRDVFDNFELELTDVLLQGDIKTFMADFTALLIACHEADIDDPYECLGDANDYLYDCLSGISNELENLICRTIFNVNSVSETVKSVMDFFLSGERSELPTTLHDKLMGKLLKENQESSRFVSEYFTLNPASQKQFPLTYLAALNHAMPSAWIKESEKLAPENADIAQELLISQAENDRASFCINAKKLFPLFQYQLVDQLSSLIDFDVEKDLAKDVLSFKVTQQRSLDDYKKLSVLFGSDTEKQNFINQLKSGYDSRFYIAVLEWEGWYDQILIYAKNAGHFLSDYNYILYPILTKYPDECYKLAVLKVESELVNNMGRDIYERAASLLRIISTVPDLKENVIAVSRELTTKYSRRTALKDELKKAGLI